MSGSIGGGVLGIFCGVRLRGFGLVWFCLVLFGAVRFGAVWCAFGLELSGKGVGMVFGTCGIWLAWTLLAFFLIFLFLLLGGEGDGREGLMVGLLGSKPRSAWRF